MLISHIEGSLPKENLPALFCGCEGTLTKDNVDLKYSLFDVYAQPECAILRSLSYPLTNLFLICFSVVDHQSYENVIDRWNVEVEQNLPRDCRKLVVGTKIDLRADQQVLTKLKQEGKAPLSFLDGMIVAKKIGALGYLECSAVTKEGLQQVFDTALDWGITTAKTSLGDLDASRCFLFEGMCKRGLQTKSARSLVV